MQISKEDAAALRVRGKKVTGGLRRAAELGGITERAARRVMALKEVRQQTYDALILGLEKLEADQEATRINNSLKAQGSQSLQLAAA